MAQFLPVIVIIVYMKFVVRIDVLFLLMIFFRVIRMFWNLLDSLFRYTLCSSLRIRHRILFYRSFLLRLQGHVYIFQNVVESFKSLLLVVLKTWFQLWSCSSRSGTFSLLSGDCKVVSQFGTTRVTIFSIFQSFCNFNRVRIFLLFIGKTCTKSDFSCDLIFFVLVLLLYFLEYFPLLLHNNILLPFKIIFPRFL